MQILRMWEMGLMGIRNRAYGMTNTPNRNRSVFDAHRRYREILARFVDNRRRVRLKLSPLQ